MVSISHVLHFSPLLSVLLGFRLISSKGDELRGVIDSFASDSLKERFLMPLDGARSFHHIRQPLQSHLGIACLASTPL